jgi:hypothetical protein
MIHGFGVQPKIARVEYEKIGRRLARESEASGLKVLPFGVHWDASPGSTGEWFPKAIAHRFTSLIGLKKAVKNPYLEKAKLACRSGRTGLRAALFRLQEAFPHRPMHLLSHSLGSELALAALAPDCAEHSEDAVPAEQPDRALNVGMVVLAGADLDHDFLCRENASARRAALDRAQVWWVTVPEKDRADGVLELRRGAGRGDAVGNRGLMLRRGDLDALLGRRGLVLDEGRIPKWHGIESYYSKDRIAAIASSMLYLEDPKAPAAASCVLARLDAVLRADPSAIPTAAGEELRYTRLYTAWRKDPQRLSVTGIALAPERTESAVAGSRQERRKPERQ